MFKCPQPPSSHNLMRRQRKLLASFYGGEQRGWTVRFSTACRISNRRQVSDARTNRVCTTRQIRDVRETVGLHSAVTPSDTWSRPQDKTAWRNGHRFFSPPISSFLLLSHSLSLLHSTNVRPQHWSASAQRKPCCSHKHYRWRLQRASSLNIKNRTHQWRWKRLAYELIS